jgi:hypothetical protein
VVGLEVAHWLSSHKTTYAACFPSGRPCALSVVLAALQFAAPVRSRSRRFAPVRRSSSLQFEAVRSSSPLQKVFASAAPGKLPCTSLPCWVCFCLCLDVFLLDLLLLVWILSCLCWICLLVLLPLQCLGSWLEVALSLEVGLLLELGLWLDWR